MSHAERTRTITYSLRLKSRFLPMSETLHCRVLALKGDLMGRRVAIEVPYEHGVYSEVGIVTGLGFPVVEVDGGGTRRYRHINDIKLAPKTNA